MAEINGNLFRVKIGTVAIGGTTDCSFTVSKELQETTNQDSAGNITYHPTAGKLGVKGSFGAFYDPDNALNGEELIDRLLNNSGLATVQVGQQGTGNTNGVYYEFSALFSDVTIDAKNDSCPTVKGNFVSSGTITKKISTGSAGS
ncbi:MAG: hypothetical protein GYA36_18705 [Veillonellaceae bacterium]|nr:hypothetical protein [Veillonellaceae bacterium]